VGCKNEPLIGSYMLFKRAAGIAGVVNFSRPLHGNDDRTDDKGSVAETLLASAQVAGHRRIRGRCRQKKGW
jgi:hypothetical protein